MASPSGFNLPQVEVQTVVSILLLLLGLLATGRHLSKQEDSPKITLREVEGAESCLLLALVPRCGPSEASVVLLTLLYVMACKDAP